MIAQLWFWMTHVHKWGEPESLGVANYHKVLDGADSLAQQPTFSVATWKQRCTECGRLRFEKVRL